MDDNDLMWIALIVCCMALITYYVFNNYDTNNKRVMFERHRAIASFKKSMVRKLIVDMALPFAITVVPLTRANEPLLDKIMDTKSVKSFMSSLVGKVVVSGMIYIFYTFAIKPHLNIYFQDSSRSMLILKRLNQSQKMGTIDSESTEDSDD